MARARNIKPGFFENEYLAELPALDRLLFIGLWTIADREGRLEDRPKRIRASILPYDEMDADAALERLAESPGNFLLRYEVNGTKYIQICNFNKHQKPHQNESASTIPPCLAHHDNKGLPPKCEDGHTDLALRCEVSTTMELSTRAESLIPITDTLIPITESLKESEVQAPPPANPPEASSGAITSQPVQRRFVPPTLEDIRLYCQGRNNDVDPQRFLDYFEASGWVDGKGNKVKNWKQKIISWEGRNNARASPANRGNPFLEMLKDGVFVDEDGLQQTYGDDSSQLPSLPCQN